MNDSMSFTDQIQNRKADEQFADHQARREEPVPSLSVECSVFLFESSDRHFMLFVDWSHESLSYSENPNLRLQ